MLTIFLLIFVAAAIAFVLIRLSGRNKEKPLSSADQHMLAATFDLFAAALKAGLSMSDAMETAMVAAPPVEARILGHIATQLKAGVDVADAWKAAESRSSLSRFGGAVTRCVASGVPIARRCAEISTEIRAELSDRSEAAAQKVGVLMTIPLALCFLPAFLCLGVIPIMLGFAEQFDFLI